MRDLRQLEAQLELVDALAAGGAETVTARAPAVSGWSVAQQLDHALKVAEFALARVVAAGAPLPRGINLLGRVLLAVGRIPRGRGKSPPAARGEERSPAELAAAVARVRGLVAQLRDRPELLATRSPLVKHPYFGGLSPVQALRMVEIHTDHHLRIVADIRRAAAKQQLH
jgi:hypothetical protein